MHPFTHRYQATERVSVIYPDDAYGSIAASAFAGAARSTTGINVDYTAAGQSPSTIDVAASWVGCGHTCVRIQCSQSPAWKHLISTCTTWSGSYSSVLLLRLFVGGLPSSSAFSIPAQNNFWWHIPGIGNRSPCLFPSSDVFHALIGFPGRARCRWPDPTW